jgi:hypothetical protein
MWLTGRLVPDHKTIADFRKDNGPAIRKVPQCCTPYLAAPTGENKERRSSIIRSPPPGRCQYDRRAMRGREHVRHDDKTASRLAPKGDDGRFNFCVAVNGRNDRRDLERPGRRLK